jgi:cytosolic carboxypeptidase protein 6
MLIPSPSSGPPARWLPTLFLLVLTGCATGGGGVPEGPGGTLPASLIPPAAPPPTESGVSTAVDVRRRTTGFLGSGVWISNELPGGWLDDAWMEGDSLVVARIRPENTPVNNSAWYAFKLWSPERQGVRVRLTYEGGRHRYWPKARTTVDGTWEPLAPEAVRIDTSANAATVLLEVGPDTVWVAGQEMFTSSAFRAWNDSLASLPHVTLATVGTSPGGRPLEMLRITEDPQARRHVFLIGRQHPPEVTGTVALVRFVEELAGPSALAREFRRHFQVHVVPLVNPDGVDLGFWRHNTNGVDLNRDWVDFRQPETRAVRDALLGALDPPGAEVWFAADFHSTNRDVFYTLDRSLETHPAGLVDRWLDGIRGALPGYEVNDSPSGLASPTSRNWFYREFGVPAVVYEVGDNTDRTLIRAVAVTAARSLMAVLIEEVEQTAGR